MANTHTQTIVHEVPYREVARQGTCKRNDRYTGSAVCWLEKATMHVHSSVYGYSTLCFNGMGRISGAYSSFLCVDHSRGENNRSKVESCKALKLYVCGDFPYLFVRSK